MRSTLGSRYSTMWGATWPPTLTGATLTATSRTTWRPQQQRSTPRRRNFTTPRSHPSPSSATEGLRPAPRRHRQVNIDYPIDVTTWTWHRDTGLWYRSYSDTGSALLGDGSQIAASNVIVMLVREWPTPYPEDITGSLENELTLKGSGPAWVFRDGAAVLREVGAPIARPPHSVRGNQRDQDHPHPRQHMGGTRARWPIDLGQTLSPHCWLKSLASSCCEHRG